MSGPRRTKFARQAAELGRAGLQLEYRRHGHPRLVDPTTGAFVVIAGTPRCPDRALAAIARDIARLNPRRGDPT